MRRALAGIALAVTSMVALSFLIPLALLVREQARNRATTAAEQRAAALSPVLALTTRRTDVQQAVSELGSSDQLVVRLPDGSLVGTRTRPATHSSGPCPAQTLTVDTSGWVYLQPVVLQGDRVAVVEAFVPARDLTRGVAASWGVMALLALGLVDDGSRYWSRRPDSRRHVLHLPAVLSASLALGSGDLDVRVRPDGPPELQEKPDDRRGVQHHGRPCPGPARRRTRTGRRPLTPAAHPR